MNGNSTQISVLTFGPVQTFLGGGQRLRDWAVGSWLCHYLTAAIIYRWENQYRGRVLLPLTSDCELLQWLNSAEETYNPNTAKFWRASLPNVITAIHPPHPDWQKICQEIVREEWMRLIENLETVVIRHPNYEKLIDGVGWKVIKRDCQYLWSAYSDSLLLDPANIAENMTRLHQRIEAQKQQRNWQGTWWGGRTSPSDGRLSIWHPGMQPIDNPKGRWGMPYGELNRWWEALAQRENLSGMFSSSDRLNSLELIRRLSSFPDIIEATLARIWHKQMPECPWGRFPDRTAAAATWIVERVSSQQWNDKVGRWHEEFISRSQTAVLAQNRWGIDKVDCKEEHYAHPRVLERRNVRDRFKSDVNLQQKLQRWREAIPEFWDSTIEWTVGWRGDGDNIGDWLSGKQQEKLGLDESQWHITSDKLNQYQPNINALLVNSVYHRFNLLRIFNLLTLFQFWNELLARLTEECYYGKVIFSGGDDFLLLGSLVDAIPLTNKLYLLWTGEETPITRPSKDSGWVEVKDTQEVYPVPGKLMSFSLGVVIAQRRVPQSLWHRGLELAYKEAKQAGKNRVCLNVLFNSGQSFTWICPWSLWMLLMSVHPEATSRTKLNRWEKLLSYLDKTHSESSITTVRKLLITLFASVGIPLTWDDIKQAAGKDGRQEIKDWQWWRDWVSIRTFLTRQELQREQWVTRFRQELAS